MKQLNGRKYLNMYIYKTESSGLCDIGPSVILTEESILIINGCRTSGRWSVVPKASAAPIRVSFSPPDSSMAVRRAFLAIRVRRKITKTAHAQVNSHSTVT